ncbi:hypothetical protein Lfu02_37140 [Longispora fulva]|uniref:Uncharacterized protein n=1 Tax=Longispora fulva TaxID=619741 RepID=A0A8J7H4Q3_9ACTN|nr:hypothetical protein [Longispora fulva]MBG6141508.1 hypothetical protein [Longispora fulva]GIG59342.1 hypothetical protein Lfu02_37140 [Longispora fulva]
MFDDFGPLADRDHGLGWMGEDPAGAVRTAIGTMLASQNETAALMWLRLVGEPYLLTGGRRVPEDPDRVVPTRAGLAVGFELCVASADAVGELRGVFSWVATGLDDGLGGAPRRDRTYLDLDEELPRASELLEERVYELDDE